MADDDAASLESRRDATRDASDEHRAASVLNQRDYKYQAPLKRISIFNLKRIDQCGVDWPADPGCESCPSGSEEGGGGFHHPDTPLLNLYHRCNKCT